MKPRSVRLLQEGRPAWRGSALARVASGSFSKATRRGLVGVVAAALVSGCGGLKIPRPVRAPAPARAKERSPSFTVTSLDGAEVSADDFAGRPLVVVAAEPGFIGDVLRWLRIIKGRAGEPGEAYRLLAVVEGGRGEALSLAVLLSEADEPGAGSLYVDLLGVPRMRAYCESAHLRQRADEVRKDEPGRAARMEKAADRIEAHLSMGRPGFRDAFGFVGEGPLVVVVAADGTLLCMIDGPPDGGRKVKLAAALDEVFGKR